MFALTKAKRGEYASHQRWVLRHVGSGIWVALQRLYVITCAGATEEEMKQNFGDGAILGAAATVLGAELAILLVEAGEPSLAGRARTKRHSKTE